MWSYRWYFYYYFKIEYNKVVWYDLYEILPFWFVKDISGVNNEVKINNNYVYRYMAIFCNICSYIYIYSSFEECNVFYIYIFFCGHHSTEEGLKEWVGWEIIPTR